MIVPLHLLLVMGFFLTHFLQIPSIQHSKIAIILWLVAIEGSSPVIGIVSGPNAAIRPY